MSDVTRPEIPTLLCGIGTATDTQALRRFLRDLPHDLGVAYLVVVHLAGDDARELTNVLARETLMPVVTLGDQKQPLSADHVYVAADRSIEVDERSVTASRLTSHRRVAIDRLFRTVAAHGGAFAVVLSGTGSDGAIGAKAVKERGGVVLVQDPDEAEHGSMPRSTIASGVADAVLPVAALASRLTQLARTKKRLGPARRGHARDATAVRKLDNPEVRELVRRLVTVQEAERQRIARDLHDQLGQSMTALRMQIEALRRWTTIAPELMADVDRIDRLAQDLDATIDFLTWELRPAALDRFGLSAALKSLLHSWSERFNVNADFHAQGTAHQPLPNDLSVNLYRILQEALHNVHKHARATRVNVLFTVREREAMMVIEDDGQGFEPRMIQSGGERKCLGLVSMRERALLIGGTLDVETAPRRGTAIFVRVPLDPGASESDGERPDGFT